MDFAFVDSLQTSSAKVAYLRFIAKAVIVAISMAFATPVCARQPASATTLNNVRIYGRCHPYKRLTHGWITNHSYHLLLQVMAVQSRPELPSLYMQWSDLKNLEHLAEGGCSIVYTAEYNHKPVIAKVSGGGGGKDFLFFWGGGGGF